MLPQILATFPVDEISALFGFAYPGSKIYGNNKGKEYRPLLQIVHPKEYNKNWHFPQVTHYLAGCFGGYYIFLGQISINKEGSFVGTGSSNKYRYLSAESSHPKKETV